MIYGNIFRRFDARCHGWEEMSEGLLEDTNEDLIAVKAERRMHVGAIEGAQSPALEVDSHRV